MGWVSPDGHNDADDDFWTDESNAYDENEESFAYTITVGKYLELTLSTPISCDKIQISVFDIGGIAIDLDIDVHYLGAWNNIHSGSTGGPAGWCEHEIGSTQTVDKARIKANAIDMICMLMEFDFNETEAPPPTYIPKVIMVT